MARVSLARQQLSDTGLMAAYSPAPLEGHTVENDGKLILHVRNDSAGPITVTILAGYVRSGLRLENRQVVIPPGASSFIGPFDPTTYNQTDGGTGQVYIDYSAVEGVTVAALKLP